MPLQGRRPGLGQGALICGSCRSQGRAHVLGRLTGEWSGPGPLPGSVFLEEGQPLRMGQCGSPGLEVWVPLCRGELCDSGGSHPGWYVSATVWRA